MRIVMAGRADDNEDDSRRLDSPCHHCSVLTVLTDGTACRGREVLDSLDSTNIPLCVRSADDCPISHKNGGQAP